MVKHEGIGFIMVNSEEFGPIVIGDGGVYYLDTDTIEGKNPLKNFGPMLPNIFSGQIASNMYQISLSIVSTTLKVMKSLHSKSWWVVMVVWVAIQSFPFMMYPSEWNLDDEQIVGAEKLHEVLKSHLNKLVK